MVNAALRAAAGEMSPRATGLSVRPTARSRSASSQSFERPTDAWFSEERDAEQHDPPRLEPDADAEDDRDRGDRDRGTRVRAEGERAHSVRHAASVFGLDAGAAAHGRAPHATRLAAGGGARRVARAFRRFATLVQPDFAPRDTAAESVDVVLQELACACVYLRACRDDSPRWPRKVGVSEATVSRVLNEKPGVSEATRQAVLTALDVLGYERPTKLRGERARLVGLFLPELQQPDLPRVRRGGRRCARAERLHAGALHADRGRYHRGRLRRAAAAAAGLRRRVRRAASTRRRTRRTSTTRGSRSSTCPRCS